MTMLNPTRTEAVNRRATVLPLSRRSYRPSNPRVSVVVPAKNEADNIREILPFLHEHYEVIVVISKHDRESAEAARAALPTAKIVEQTRKGKGNAMACGFAEVTGDAVVMFDIDGSADPREIPLFVEALTAGADFAKGSRFCTGGGSSDVTALRAAGTIGLTKVASVLTRSRFTDLCYGYNAFWADQLPLLDLPPVHLDDERDMIRGDGFEIEAMIISRFALSTAIITEVPSFEYDRYHGAFEPQHVPGRLPGSVDHAAGGSRTRPRTQAAQPAPSRVDGCGRSPAHTALRTRSRLT